MLNKDARNLDYCLTKIQSGAMTLEQALTAYPKHAGRLRELLEFAQTLRHELVPADPKPGFIRDSRSRIEHAIHSKFQPTTHILRPSRRLTLRPAYLLFVLVLITAIFGSGYGVYSASAASLPGDFLYSIKRAGEEVQLILSYSDTGDLQLLLNLAQERLDEYQALLDAARYDDLERALAGFEREVERLGERSVEGEIPSATFDHLDDQLEKHIQKLELIRDQVPGSAILSIEKALDKTRHSQAVIETLQEGGRPSDLAPGQQDKQTGNSKDSSKQNEHDRSSGEDKSKGQDKEKQKDK
jgi:hypothetical protein